MRILLSTYGSRGDVEPIAGLALALRALGAEAVVSAPAEEEFAELLARAGVPLAPAFMPVREWIKSAKKTPADLPTYAARMIGKQYDAIGTAAEGCDAIVATGLMPSAAAAQCVAEKRGLRYEHVSFCPLFLPSHHHRPFPYPGHPLPPEVTDPRALWELNVRAMNALFGGAVNVHRASIGLPTVDNVRDHVFTDRPLLASDPVVWPWLPTDLCAAVQTGAWILPDQRPLPADLEAFLNAGAPPVYVGFGSIAIPTTKIAAQAAIEAIRAQGRRVVLARGWADMARSTTVTTASSSARSTSRHCSAGLPPSCIMAARARRQRPPGQARLRWSYPRSWTSPTGRGGWLTSASARRTTVRSRPSSPCQPRSGRPWRVRPAHARPRWPARSVPTGRRWPQSFCSTRGRPAASGCDRSE
jgi:vancomycin aglycone glucosyltransferase